MSKLKKVRGYILEIILGKDKANRLFRREYLKYIKEVNNDMENN